MTTAPYDPRVQMTARHATGSRRERRWVGLLTQTLLVVLAALAYFAVRGITHSSRTVADANAHRIEDLERAVHLDHERWLQGLVIDHGWLVTLANWIYIYGHWPLIAVVMLGLYLRVPERFRLLRNAMFISGAIGLVIFVLFPVAPPRLGLPGMVDTITDRSSSYRTLQPPQLVNPYAAVPSLHFGWNLLVGVVLWHSTHNRALRTFAACIPVLMAFAVLATANHYLFDVLAGAIVALTGLLIAHLWQRNRPMVPSTRGTRR